MTGAVLFGVFAVLALIGVPIGVSLGLGGVAAIVLSNADSQWFGLMAAPQNFHAGLAKYPLLALPMFVLVGTVFDRSGVAQRLINLAVAVFGRSPGMLPLVAIVVAMVFGGISGSGPANAAAVGGVMIAAMSRAGYPPGFSASVVGAAAATDILIPPSLAFVIYGVLVPGASIPALFAAGLIPGLLAGIALIVPAVWLSRRHGFGAQESSLPCPPFWPALKDASWGLAAPILILGGMRAGWFTPTEAAVVAAAYGLFVGIAIHRSIRWRDLFGILREAAELSAVIGVVVGLSGIFGYAVSTLGLADPVVAGIQNLDLGSLGTLALLFFVLVIAGMFLDGISLFIVLIPLLYPLMRAFGWDPVWFGVWLTLLAAIGQFTPPLAVNLMVSCKLAGVGMEQTLRWVGWLILSFSLVAVLIALFPTVALWLPRALGY
jgi:C4-dicarboxylate transporter DctM subunit